MPRVERHSLDVLLALTLALRVAWLLWLLVERIGALPDGFVVLRNASLALGALWCVWGVTSVSLFAWRTR